MQAGLGRREAQEGKDGLQLLVVQAWPRRAHPAPAAAALRLLQIVSEAADACAHAMLVACPPQRLLPRLCTMVAGDRNGRLRQAAAEYLLVALERWGPADCERQADAIERAVLAAAADAQAETRATGRALFGAYAHGWPGAAQAALARLERDRPLQERLAAAAADYVPGGCWREGVLLVAAAPAVATTMSQPSSAFCLLCALRAYSLALSPRVCRPARGPEPVAAHQPAFVVWQQRRHHASRPRRRRPAAHLVLPGRSPAAGGWWPGAAAARHAQV